MHGHHHYDFGILPFLSLLGVFVVWLIYIFSVIRERTAGHQWPNFRVFSFSAGVLILASSLHPALHHFSLEDIRSHMTQHLLIGMLAPIGLAFGYPVTLVLRTLPKFISRSLVFILHSRVLRLLTHPVSALILNIGGMAILYLTPLYLISQNHLSIHILVHIHFLLAGYLFVWSIVGPDPAPKRPGFVTRLGVLFLAISGHATLSKYMYAHVLPRGTNHPDWQIQQAAKLMYYGGDFSEFLLLVILFYWAYRKGTLAIRPLKMATKTIS